MSLKVWLPLDGDLKNLGASGTEIISNGVTTDINGKIGSCYSFSPDNSSYLRLNTAPFDNNTTEFSFTCWFKPNASHIGCLFSNRSSTVSAGITLWYYNSVFYFDAGDRWTSVSNASATIGAWNHLAFTWKLNGKKRIYVNGNIVGEENATTALTSATIGTAFIGAAQTTANHDAIPGGSYFNGYLNDVRIYDQCLSAAEVHEIAQGLIAHYKLDKNGFGNNNLLYNTHFDKRYSQTTGWDTIKNGTLLANAWDGYNAGVSNAATVYHAHLKEFNGEYVYEYIKTSNETWLGICQGGLQYRLVSGKTYTFSWEQYSVEGNNYGRGGLYYYTTGATSASFNLGMFSGANTITGKWQKFSYTFTAPNDGDYSKSMVWYIYGHYGGNGILYIRHPKLEEGSKATNWCPSIEDNLYNNLGLNNNIITDSSGYNHNATTPSVLATTGDTPRYSIATTFDGTNYGYIQSTMVESSHLSSEYTWAGWIYRDYTDATARYLYNGITKIYLNTNFSTRMQWNHSKSDGTSSTNTSDMGIIIPYREWTHLVWTFKDGYLKIYINGEYKNYSDRTGTGQFIKGYTNQMIGTNTSSSGQWIGGISDMRIYTTALLDNDIKLLYNMGMKVDNLQNLHTFEYKENTSNLFRSELIMPFAKTGYTEGNGNITTRNGSPAMDIRANIFYQNLENSTSGFLKGYFEANTSYVFDMWIDTDAVIYNGNNVAGGLRIIYTDDSFEHTFVFTGGNKGWQHKVYITPSNKTIDRIEVYYYVGQPVYCRLDSCICPLSNLKLYKTGIFEGTNLLEETNTKLIKNALIETNEIIEI